MERQRSRYFLWGPVSVETMRPNKWLEHLD